MNASPTVSLSSPEAGAVAADFPGARKGNLWTEPDRGGRAGRIEAVLTSARWLG